MKKMILLAAVTVAVISTACRKERTCECTTTETTVTTGVGAGTETKISSTRLTMAKQKKGEFKLTSDCVSSRDVHTYDNGPSTDQVTTERKCDLK